MESRTGNEVVENNITCPACSWLTFVCATLWTLDRWPGGGAGGGGVLYHGKRRKFHQVHILPSYSSTSGPKLDLFYGSIT